MEALKIEVPTSIENGLTQEQAAHAIKNEIEQKTTKSYKSIFLEHIFTFFNILNFVLAALVIYTGSWRNLLFMGTVLCNMVIGLVQEIRAKQTLDKLSLLHQDQTEAIRDGKTEKIPIDRIALNDILVLYPGDEVPCDVVVVKGSCQANESMLTGESDAIDKQIGDSLYSGSFITAGKVWVQAVRVGTSTYAASVLHTAKRNKRYPSQLRDALNMIIKICTIILIPAGILLFIRSFFISHYTLNDSIISCTAAMIGMIPEGLVILTSIALAVSSMKLAKEKVLVQELYCIETLARVDVLCLDKTGTITQGTMRVDTVEPLHDESIREIGQILADFYASSEDDNVTAQAIREYVAEIVPRHKSSQVFPFSSTEKCSGAVFGDTTWLIGAAGFILDHVPEEVESRIQSYARQGIRVLLLARAPRMEKLQKGNYEPVALIGIQDVMRPNVHQTLSYFEKQDVQIKIISGDMPETVAAIAARAGIQGKWIDMSAVHDGDLQQIVDTYTIFGRVTPEQKKDMILALKAQGHTVAMTGDGVNDVMALKEADCSIAMGSGTQAARSIASLVLLENQFNAMPSILLEGRRVINNIQRTASLFLVKTLFSFGISLLTVFWLSIYPFEPIQLTLISSLGVGIPAFILTLEPNYDRVSGSFLANVLGRAIPGALSVITAVIVTKLLQPLLQADGLAFSSICTWLAGMNSLWVLYMICNPMTRLRQILLITMTAGFLGAIVFLPQVFYMTRPDWLQLLYIAVMGTAIPYYLRFLRRANWPGILERMHVHASTKA